MTSHPDTPDRQNPAGTGDSPTMGRDPELVLAQAAIGRGLLTVLRDSAGEVLDVDDLRAALFTVHRGMAATYTEEPATARVHQLAAQLLAGD